MVTDSFVPLVEAQAQLRSVTPKMLVVKHPVGGLNESELRERIDTAYAALKAGLKV